VNIDQATVTLSWDDPEAAGDFLALREDLRAHGWLPDTAAARLQELVRSGNVVTSGGDEAGDG
jgi:hypothetical protein